MNLGGGMKLKPCPLCGSTDLKVIKKDMFHLSFAFVEDDYVEYNFHSARGIHCDNCALTLPEIDPDFPDELAKYWNKRV